MPAITKLTDDQRAYILGDHECARCGGDIPPGTQGWGAVLSPDVTAGTLKIARFCPACAEAVAALLAEIFDGKACRTYPDADVSVWR